MSQLRISDFAIDNHIELYPYLS